MKDYLPCSSDKFGTSEHSISQTYQRRFACLDQKSHVWRLDKKTGELARRAIKTTFCETGNFDVPPSVAGGEKLTSDSVFTEYERAGNAVIEKIVATRSLCVLRNKQRRELSRWVGALLAASQSEKYAYLQLHPEIVKRRRSSGQDNFGVNESYESAMTVFALQVAMAPRFTEQVLLSRKWVLRETAKEYVLGDSPVVRFGQHSLACDATEVALPLSPNLLLHMYRPFSRETNFSEIVAGDDRDSSGPILDNDEATEFLNFEQLNWAERRIIASSKEVLAQLYRWTDGIPGVKDSPRYRFVA